MDTDPFDPAEFLDSEEARAEYVRAALETGDAAFVARALAAVARAREAAALGRGGGSGAPAREAGPAARPRGSATMEIQSFIAVLPDA